MMQLGRSHEIVTKIIGDRIVAYNRGSVSKQNNFFLNSDHSSNYLPMFAPKWVLLVLNVLFGY